MGDTFDSIGLTFLAVLAIVLLALAVALVISRRSGQRTAKPREPRRRTRNPDGERPVHFDPDPDRMAGGRARFTPPFGDGKG